MHKPLLARSLMACTPDRAGSPERAVPAVASPAPTAAPPLVGVIAAQASEIVSARIEGRVLEVIAKSGAQGAWWD